MMVFAYVACSRKCAALTLCVISKVASKLYSSKTTKCIVSKMYKAEERGTANTKDYRVFIKNAEGIPVSPLHDIPLRVNDESNIFNMVVEIPRWTNAKMEICLKERLNPIKQDIKKDKLRYVDNCFPYHGYIWNYGAFPQTWENPNVLDHATGYKGDNDPIDVCEIGYKVAKCGEVVPVKVLGVIALIDEGETDWKILAINKDDPLAPKLNDVADIEKEMPGFLHATVEWFKIYKIPAGKPANKFAFDGEAKNAEFALQVINEVNNHWKELILKDKDDNEDITCENVAVFDSPNRIDKDAATTIYNESPCNRPKHEVDQKVNTWHFIK